MNPAGAENATSLVRTWRRRQRRLLLAILTVGALLAMALAGVISRQEKVSAPPRVELADPDPAIAAALQSARDEVLSSPASSAAWGRLGMLLLNCNFFTEARQCFVQAQQLAPREPAWPYYHALTLLSDDPQQAIDKLRQTIQLCGDDPDAPRLRLAELLIECGQTDEAEEQFRLSRKANPANSRACLGLARLALERGELQRSRQLLTEAVQSRFTERNARSLLAQVEQRLGNEQAAEQARIQAEASSRPPSWPDPYLDKLQKLRVGRQARIDRITVLLADGRIAEAAAQAEEVVRAYPKAGMGWLLLGEARMQLQQFQAAEAALHRAVQQMPDSVEAHFALGSALFVQKEHAQAASYFRRVVELKPTSATAYYNLGLCLVKRDDPAARQAFQKAIQYRPQFADAHRALGELLARTGDKAQAIEHYRAALQINPHDQAAQKAIDALQKR